MRQKSILLVGLAMIAGSLSASAEGMGDMAAGINLGVAPCLEKNSKVTNFEIGAKFQYYVSNPVRLEAAVNYGFKSKGMDVLTVGVNAHYIFKVGDKLGIYPLIGLGYGRIGGGYETPEIDWEDVIHQGYMGTYDYDDDDVEMSENSMSLNRFYFNVGAGAEYSFSSKLSAGIEIKYQYMKNFGRLPINLGVTYRF